MNQRFYGSICVTDLIEMANKRHSAFTKGDNGKIYCNVNVWLNAEEDKYGNIMSMQVSPTKDRREQDGQAYIGNMKASKPKEITERDASKLSLPSDLPTASKADNETNKEQDFSDLPF